jgi:C-3',4' desaturase CrtD
MTISHDSDVVIIGAGISGLTAGAVLARSGARVLILERHYVAGGCASFFQRAGYRFDVGATLVGGFGERGVHRRLFERFGIAMPAQRIEPAMVVHLPNGDVVRYGDNRWRAERLRAFGPAGEVFWRKQEQIADRAWDFAAGFPMLPADGAGLAALLGAFRPRHLPLVATLGRTVADIMPAGAGPALRAFVDAQLLITAQTGAAGADLAYGATALDLAREGTFHLDGGVAAIATALARAVRRFGGNIAYRTTAAEIVLANGRACGVRLADGRMLRAGSIISAIPVQNVAAMLPPDAPLAARTGVLPARWGAFMAYVALPPGAAPDDGPLHHQVVADDDAPPGEGNTAFLSLSGTGERGRAPAGGRALTVSTHTDVAAWERATADGAGMEDVRRRFLAGRLRQAVERALPGAWDRARFVELATPATFAHYTGRWRGLVGGLPQTPAAANLGAFSHVSGTPGLVLAGDTVFPGQSTVGASLSGVAAARACGARL